MLVFFFSGFFFFGGVGWGWGGGTSPSPCCLCFRHDKLKCKEISGGGFVETYQTFTGDAKKGGVGGGWALTAAGSAGETPGG